MLASSRRFEAPELHAFLSTHALIHPRARLHAVHNAGVVSEDEVLLLGFARAGRIKRPTITVLLEGIARLSIDDRAEWLAPSDVALLDRKVGIRMRQEGSPYAAFSLEWDQEFFGAPTASFARHRLDDAALHRLRALHVRLRAGLAVQARAPLLIAVIDELRAIGLPLRSIAAGELEDEVGPRFESLSGSLDRVLSNLGDQPMATDLETELDLSLRQVNRLVQTFNERYGFNAGSWRDTRNRRRLLMGATLMTAPGATTDYVARAVGYRSAAAFSRGLADAGLPRPSELRAAVAKHARTAG